MTAMVLILGYTFLTSVQIYVIMETSEPIESKFEPWLWDKVQELETNGTTRFIVIGVSINCKSYGDNVTAAYSFKMQVATLLTQKHNATILYIGKVLSFVNVKVRVPEIKRIANYEFVDGLADGERKGSVCLDVSTTTIRSNVVNIMGYNGSDKRVAVLDTGIYADHPDFAGKNITWIDFVNGNLTPYDDNGHGTHCAGIVAGTGQSSSGKYKGVVPGVTTLIIGKMANQYGSFQESDARAALDWAVSERAQIISCSWGIFGNDCNGQCQLCKKADECVSKGVVVVVAAGNKGNLGTRTIGCPGTAFNVITVGATNDINTKHIKDDEIALFPNPWLYKGWWRDPWGSSIGPTRDQRNKPDVVAPGVHIWSCRAPAATIPTFEDLSGQYAEASGTSMATPHVAGVAALILQAHPTWTPQMVKYAIKESAMINDQLVDPDPQHLPENIRGTGIVDASRAVSLQITNIPADQAETSYTSGNPTYTAKAYLNGTYEISAGTIDYSDDGYAIATLNKTFVQEYNLTNPRFLFTFHDEGYMIAQTQEPAELNATFKLFTQSGNLLFTSNQQIHSISQGQQYYNDSHTTEYTYLGNLYAQQTYKIEYGFSTYAPKGAFTSFEEGANGKIVAEWISTIDGAIFGPGNPGFEERLLFGSIYNASY
jgi:subtilisin family serine protease